MLFTFFQISHFVPDIFEFSFFFFLFLFFHGILCDTLKKSRGKNLIIVPL